MLTQPSYTSQTRRFPDRFAAGRVLADQLDAYRNRTDVVVLALPRGGVPVGYEVARELRAPLDAFVVRKLGLPSQPELAMGAIASGGVRVLNDDVLRGVDVADHVIDRVTEDERRELDRRERLYRPGAPPLNLTGLIAILVDDGLATGSTMRAAIVAARRLGASRVVVAVPVAPDETCRRLAAEADEVVCPLRPVSFWAIGEWYDDFDQIGDHEVRALLDRTRRTAASGPTQ